jgi:hypothetical protein
MGHDVLGDGVLIDEYRSPSAEIPPPILTKRLVRAMAISTGSLVQSTGCLREFLPELFSPILSLGRSLRGILPEGRDQPRMGERLSRITGFIPHAFLPQLPVLGAEFI